MKRNVALVAGATGVVGRALLEHLETQENWDVVAVSRRSPDFRTRAQHLPLDLEDPAECARLISQAGPITHLFYAAYAAKPTQQQETATNFTMLRNLVESAETVATISVLTQRRPARISPVM
jgi:nucleoside-diphosphate-sugar epimerase